MKTPLAVRQLPTIAVLALCACATTPKPPEDALRNAANAVASAEDARASDYAAPEMRSAHEKLRAAQTLAQQATADPGNPNAIKAGWLAEEASADASLAEAKAREVRTQSVVRDLQSKAAAPPPAASPSGNGN